METVLKNKDSIVGINMVLSEALYYLTHTVEAIWRYDPTNAIN
ncbi:hypothetical protein [Mucilaginibacter corticis]|nr:hypothetical protein [Mucilaginibacter corticis]